MRPERFAHEIARKERRRWLWRGLVEAAIRCHSKAAKRTRRQLVARTISDKKFHQIRARQDAALDARLAKIEQEIFRK